MSRIGAQIITIPENTEVTQDGDVVSVQGPHGTLKRTIRPEIQVEIHDTNTITLTPRDTSGRTQALWGTFASHISNMIQGVNKPFEKRLLIQGVGYRAEAQGDALVLHAGHSHPVSVPIPEGITATVDGNTTILVSGIDKELVGEFSARVRAVRKPEPYKGKGIRYEDEIVRMKEGKKNV